jgi:asparagine N-glycosylation enzyme membrane subunit Stt3
MTTDDYVFWLLAVVVALAALTRSHRVRQVALVVIILAAPYILMSGNLFSMVVALTAGAYLYQTERLYAVGDPDASW